MKRREFAVLLGGAAVGVRVTVGPVPSADSGCGLSGAVLRKRPGSAFRIVFFSRH
jgi:hypothetical protein